MTWFGYLLQTNIYLIILYAFYFVFLKNETFFKLNRVYLISSGILAFLIPLTDAEWVRTFFVNEKVYQAADSLNVLYFTANTDPTIEQASVNWLLIAYLTGFAIFLSRFIIRFLQVCRQRPDQGHQPYSFFGRIVVPDDLPDRHSILKHEVVHVRQLHSADVVLFEVISIINWFNPIVYVYKKAVKLIHEFIADEAAAKTKADKSEYSLLLLSTAFGVSPSGLSNNFYNESLLKLRIRMLHKSKSHRIALIKYGLSAPLFFCMVIFSSATIDRYNSLEEIKSKISEINVVSTGPNGTSIIKAARKILGDTVVSDSTKTRGGAPLKYLYSYVARNTIYPSKARFNNIQGDVVSSFRITSNGSLEDINIVRGLGSGIDEEVLRTLKKVNKMDPTVAGKYYFRISFSLEGTGAEAKDTPINIPEGYKELSPIMIVGYPTRVPSTTLSSGKTAEGDAIHDFASIDVMPNFPGGMDAFYTYVSKNYKYPEDARKNNITGRLIVSFIVEKDGSLEDIRTIRDLGYGTGEEAVRMLKNTPKWQPGMQDGRPVRVQYTLPILVNLTREQALTFRHNPLPNALYIIDGVEKPSFDLQSLKPSEIQSVIILKDKQATDKYGDKGKNGVIIITTKKKTN